MEAVINVLQYLEQVNAIFEDSKYNKHKKHLFFRGHSNSKTYKLVPSVLRCPRKNEKEILLDFKQYAPAHQINYDYIKERDKMLADMQHHLIPTRLLDWTFAPLNALFFACSGDDADAEVIVFDPWSYWKEIVRDKGQKEIHQIHIISRALLSGGWKFDDITNFIQREYQYIDLKVEDMTKPFAFVANYTNGRILHQRGCFSIHGIDGSSLDCHHEFTKCSTRISIEGTAKEDLRKELNRLYINDYSIYPDFYGMEKMIGRNGGLFNI